MRTLDGEWKNKAISVTRRGCHKTELVKEHVSCSLNTLNGKLQMNSEKTLGVKCLVRKAVREFSYGIVQSS